MWGDQARFRTKVDGCVPRTQHVNLGIARKTEAALAMLNTFTSNAAF